METKVGFQLRNFCTYAECFAKEHAHWGENILKINFRKKKLKCSTTFFHKKRKDFKRECQHVRKPVFSVFTFVDWIAKR